jgi:hypothetical protein
LRRRIHRDAETGIRGDFEAILGVAGFRQWAPAAVPKGTLGGARGWQP